MDGYTIDAQINPATQTLSAHVTVRFIPLDDQANSATFELNNNLNISQITDARGNHAELGAHAGGQHACGVTFPALCRRAR